MLQLPLFPDREFPCAERDAFWRWVAHVETQSFRREVRLTTVMAIPTFRPPLERASRAAVLDIRRSTESDTQLGRKWNMHPGSVRRIRLGMRHGGVK